MQLTSCRRCSEFSSQCFKRRHIKARALPCQSPFVSARTNSTHFSVASTLSDALDARPAARLLRSHLFKDSSLPRLVRLIASSNGVTFLSKVPVSALVTPGIGENARWITSGSVVWLNRNWRSGAFGSFAVQSAQLECGRRSGPDLFHRNRFKEYLVPQVRTTKQRSGAEKHPCLYSTSSCFHSNSWTRWKDSSRHSIASRPGASRRVRLESAEHWPAYHGLCGR
jgi:hypothetical protein